MKKTPLVDIYILNTNARENIRITLKKLAALSYPKRKLRITVCDNNSIDGSKEMLAKKFPHVTVIPLKKNHGMSGLNYGFRKRRGALCFVLDDDSYFESSAISDALDEFAQDPALGILACHAIFSNGQSEFKHFPQKGPSILWCDFFGGAAVVHSRVFDDVGYFNPDILIYGHEVDFSLRVLDAGWNIKFAPDIHVHRVTPPNVMNAFRMSLGVRNFPSVYWRFLSFPRAFSMTVIMLLEYFVIALRTGTLSAYARGIVNFAKNIPYVTRTRRQVSREAEAFWSSLFPFTVTNTLRRLMGAYRIPPS